MDDKERWDNVCEPMLNGIKDDVKTLVKIVKDGNGVPGLVTRIAVLEKSVEGLVVSQQIPQKQPEQVKTVSKGSKPYTKFKAFGNEFSTNDPSVQNGIKIFIMIVGIFIGIGAMVFIINHMNDTRTMLLDKIHKVETKVND